MSMLHRSAFSLLVVAIFFSHWSSPAQSLDLGELEFYFTQLLLRDWAFPLQEKECHPAAVDYPPEDRIQRSPYQLVRKMQAACNRLDQSVGEQLAAPKRGLSSNQPPAGKRVDELVESVVRAHALLKMGAVIIGYDDLYALHSQIINDYLRRFAYPKELDEILRNYHIGFENQNVLLLHKKMVRRYERYRNDALRMKVTIDRAGLRVPLNQIGIAVVNEGTASHDARLFAESLSLQLCQPIVANHHLKYYLDKAAQAYLTILLTDYFFVDPNDLAKVRFVEETQKHFQQERIVQLKDPFSDPGIATRGATTEHEHKEYGSISVPLGRYYFYTRDTRPSPPFEANFVVEARSNGADHSGVMVRVGDLGATVVVTLETFSRP